MAELMHPLAGPFTLEGSNGQAVVLLHGFTGTAGQFRMMGTFLNEHGYTVHAPLLPGHGTRLEDLATVTRHDWLQAARRAVDEVRDHDRVHVVGLSMGGLLTLNIEEVASITTIDTPIKLYDWRWKLLWLIKLVKPVVLFEEEETFDAEAAEYAIDYGGFPTVAAVELRRLIRETTRRLPQVTAPALIVQSKADDTVRPESAEIIYRRISSRQKRIAWLETSRHNALLDPERMRLHRFVLEHLQAFT